MGIKFYWAPYSTAGVTVAVLAELEHGGKPLAERVKVDFSKKETRTPEFLANVNPNGLVPALVVDGTAIWESAAITIYLGETYGVGKGVFPESGVKRGEALKWIVWTNVSLATHAGRLGESIHCDDKEDAVKKANGDAAKKGLDHALGVLDGALADREYLTGEYSLADTHIWSLMSWLTMLKVDVDKFANVKAWRERVGSRPGLQNLD